MITRPSLQTPQILLDKKEDYEQLYAYERDTPDGTDQFRYNLPKKTWMKGLK